MILIPVSAGELADKITILRIKRERLSDPVKRGWVETELAMLEDVAERQVQGFRAVEPLVAELFAINAELWDIEDAKRACERTQTFDARFIQLARDVYLKNDRRAALKRRISEACGGEIMEAKSHQGL